MRAAEQIVNILGGRSILPPAVFIPAGLGFDAASFPITPTINDPGGMALATGDAGITPQAMFDLFSTARSAPDITYFVGPAGTGSDSNNGTSAGTPFATIGKAITAANAGSFKALVKIANGGATDFFRALGPAGAIPANDIAFTATGGRITTGTFDNFGTFTLDATLTNCYSLALTSIDRVCNRLVQSAFKTYGVFTNTDHTKTVDATTLNATTPTTADLWATDATKIYIRRVDGAVPTPTNTRIYRGSVSLFKFTTAVNVYMENIDAEGGDTVGTFNYLLAAQSALKRVFVANNCSAKYAGGVINTSAKGFGIDGMHGLAYLYGCEASANATDGINFHDNVASGLQWLTVNCSGTDNGRGTSQSNNGHTGHETATGIDLAGYYPNNRGGSVRHIIATKSLFAGTYSTDLGDVTMGGTVPPTAFQVDNASTMWVDRTKAPMPGGQNAYMSTTGAIMHRRNAKSGPGSITGGAGTIDNY